MDWNRIALPIACLVAFVGLVMRLGLHRRSSGTWAITFFRRRGSPHEAALATGLVVLLVGVPLWVAVYALRGPAAVGVVPPGPALTALGWALVVGGGLLVAL